MVVVGVCCGCYCVVVVVVLWSLLCCSCCCVVVVVVLWLLLWVGFLRVGVLLDLCLSWVSIGLRFDVVGFRVRFGWIDGSAWLNVGFNLQLFE